MESESKNGNTESLAEGSSHKVVVSLGSNYGERRHHIERAVRQMKILLGDRRVSDIYETPEIHGVGAPYLNAVIIGETRHPYDVVHAMTKVWEKAQGRSDEMRARGDVPVDIDIVVWDGEVIRRRDFEQTFFKIGYDQLIRN